jgi:hypothetical protein
MPALYATELDGPRSDITALLDTVAAVERTGDTYPCRLRDDGMVQIEGLPSYFKLRQVRIKFPHDVDVRVQDIVDVDDEGEFRIISANEPQNDSLSLRTVAVATGDGAAEALSMYGQIVTFEDTSSSEKIENVPVLIYQSSQAIALTPQAVNFTYAVVYSQDIAYPTKGAPDYGDRLKGLARMPYGAYMDKPYPYYDPMFPFVLTFIQETN